MYFKVFVSGTFDNLHPGHLNYFQQAWNLAKNNENKLKAQLIVIIALDENVFKAKGKLPRENHNIRLKKVKQYLLNKNYNHIISLGNKRKKFLLLKKYQPQIICLGYDQEIDIKKLSKNYIIKRLKAYYPDKYKSSYCIY